MGFKVGDRVVYPHHGAAVIERKEKREMFGEKVEYLVLRVTHGDLTLMVPVEKAEEVGIRPPVSKDEVEDILDVLAKKDARMPSNWSRRFKNHLEKLKSGDVYQVAEVGSEPVVAQSRQRPVERREDDADERAASARLRAQLLAEHE